MKLLAKLQNNKGTISTALGKELAAQVLTADLNLDLLKELISFCIFETNNRWAKNIRATAAKAVEIVAEQKPKLVAPYLKDLLVALSVNEPQTRWMIIAVFGLCAQENPTVARRGIGFAQNYLAKRQGVCLSGAAALCLGKIGALSIADAKKSFLILMKALPEALPNEVDWILEAFLCFLDKLDQKKQKELFSLVSKYENAPKKITQKRVAKILEMLSCSKK